MYVSLKCHIILLVVISNDWVAYSSVIYIEYRDIEYGYIANVAIFALLIMIR